MIKKYSLDDLKNIKINIKNPFVIFLYGDLGVGKTTFTKHIINNLIGFPGEVKSPTYNYYNKLEFKKDNQENINIYHFDLYRLKNYDEFFAIGAEEIFDNNNGIIIVEWPEIIEDYYKPDLKVKIKKTSEENKRIFEFIY